MMKVRESPKNNLIWAIWPQIIEQAVKMRWWIVVIVLLISGALETDRLMVLGINYYLSYNTWDAVFSLFSNGNFLLYIATTLFLLMVFDLIVDSPFEQQILNKMGSRKQWWWSKVVLLIISVMVFLILGIGISLGIASFSLPWQSHWSTGMQANPQEIYLPNDVLQTTPALAFIQLVMLLGLGWLGLGMMVLVIGILTRSSIKGFFAGISLNLLGVAIYKMLFDAPMWIQNLTLTQRMFYGFHYLENRLPIVQTVEFSIFFFLVWCGLFLWWGLSVCKKKEFLGGELS